jgi:hypothetical protein
VLAHDSIVPGSGGDRCGLRGAGDDVAGAGAQFVDLGGAVAGGGDHQGAAATAEAFFTRFLVQCAIPDAQLSDQGHTLYLVDVVSGSVAVLTRQGEGWQVREGGPGRLWDRAESVLDAYDHAGCPPPETFQLEIDPAGQCLRHPRMPELRLARN